MKKLLILSYLWLAIPLNAGIRTTDEAMAAASRFLMQSSVRRSSSLRPQQTLRLVATGMQKSEDVPAYYVINQGDDEGFVIVSADNRCRTILGYVEEGSYSESHVPANVRLWLEHYAEEMSQLPSSEIVPYYNPHANVIINPLLGDIMWNQDSPFNNQCPIDADGARSVTGCIATAAAQIMYYWKYPEHGVGTHAYNWKNSAGTTTKLEVNFETTTYAWEKMTGNYTSWYDMQGRVHYSYSDAQAQAVATLMYHVGVACDTKYHSSGSSSFSDNVAEAFRRDFGYDKGLRLLYKDCMSQTQFTQALLNELQAGRPVLMTGQKQGEGGHAFICDGLDKNGLFHINWGWGGYMNGFFALTTLHPEHEGIGGVEGEGGYTIGIDAIVGIQPDRGNLYSAPFVGADKIDFMPLAIARDSDLGIDAVLINYGPSTWRGFLAVNVYQNSECILSSDLLDTCDVPSYQGFHVSGDDAINFAGLPEGRYKMALEYNALTDTAFKPVYTSTETPYYDVIIDADSAHICRSTGEYYTLSTYVVGPGRIQMSSRPRVESGSEVIIEAVPAAGARFLHWNSAQIVTAERMEDAVLSLRVDSNMMLAAVFGYEDQVINFNYGVEKGEEHLGTVTARVLADEVENIYLPADKGLYPKDCKVELTAHPTNGENFLMWNKTMGTPAYINPRKVMLYSEEGFWAHFTGTTAIETIAAPLDRTAPMYNILGVQVDASYRGIILQNGYKYCNY